MPRSWNQPEVHIALFGFRFAFLWENLQMPFYDMTGLTCWQRTLNCARATFGDAGILVLAYSVASLRTGNRKWMHHSVSKGILPYLVTGVIVAFAVEEVATRVPVDSGWGWRYSEMMPVVPGTQTRLVPLVMWLVELLATLWIARRQPRPVDPETGPNN